MRFIKTLILCTATSFVLVACNNKETIKFDGIAAGDKLGSAGLYNPARGLRLEVAVDVIEDKADPTKTLREQVEIYKADSVSMVQTYIYLTNIVGHDITEEHFEPMQAIFDEFQKLGMKSVLRFAYERDFNGREAVGPTLEQALTHIEQLKPFLEKNSHLIHVVQAGIIGAWGEWHSSVHGLDQSREAQIAILKKLLEVVPSHLAVQIRVPEYKNLLKDEPELYKRLSFHDDMIIIQPHKWDGNMHEGTAFFDQIVGETDLLPMDGELPWGFWSVNQDADSPDPGWLIDGHQAARRFYLQHFSTLSAVHNYLEPRGRIGKEDEVKFSMQLWKEESMDTDFLKKEGMPIASKYFETKGGEKASRNVFEYVRDYLGYRIELQSLELDKAWEKGTNQVLKLDLINRGFSTVFGNYDVHFVLIDKDNKVIESKTDAQVFDWQPKDAQRHTIQHSITLPTDLASGDYQLGLWIADASKKIKYDNRYAIRCANGNTDWYVSRDKRYGINVLTTISVK